MLDFAALPPEVNSVRMYSGPGSGSMLAAAAAWNRLANEIRSAATAYDSVLRELLGADWFGPSSVSMLTAAVPYLAWLNTTAAQAEQSGSQAIAAATAFEAAYTATVPPPVVAANRNLLAELAASNIFGQNTPAIAAADTEYTEMWAQDAEAMNGYATASTAAARMAPFTSPQTNTIPDAAEGQTQTLSLRANSVAGNAQSSLSANTCSVKHLADPPAAPTSGSLYDYLTQFFGNTNNTAAGQFLSSNFFSNSILNGTIAGGPFNPQTIVRTVERSRVLTTQATMLSGLDEFAFGAEGATSATSLPSNTIGPAGFTGASAGIGNAHLVGSMSVPPSWNNAATITPAQTSVPVGGLRDIGTSAAPTAGGPGGVAGAAGGTGKRLRRAVPKYGFRPTVMPRPPSAG